MQSLKYQCRFQHENMRNSRVKTMVCPICEDDVEVTEEQTCMCCGYHVKKAPTLNKDIKKFKMALKETKPFLEQYRINEPEHCKICVVVPIGRTLFNVELKYIDMFSRTNPDDYNSFLSVVKKNSQRVAFNVW